ncbi:Cip1-interacting zinc finger protein [Microtus ochrogaster]|uniref:Cip1-interacting zinc finger protein n=1 Tax=Microtus ochrogaster TaxID=79684 RepID=A0A8J6G7X9_MICOH|nr:Cip1-interacting zinc finger protein [Microtus ochrogaster]
MLLPDKQTSLGAHNRPFPIPGPGNPESALPCASWHLGATVAPATEERPQPPRLDPREAGSHGCGCRGEPSGPLEGAPRRTAQPPGLPSGQATAGSREAREPASPRRQFRGWLLRLPPSWIAERGLPQQSSPQQLLNLQGTHSASLLNGSMLQRALLLQQLQGNLRAYNMTAPSLPAPSLTPPQMVTPNLQQFFPQATRQSLLGPPPVGVPMNPSQLSHSGRNSQKQARTPSTTPNHKTVPLGDREDPTEGSEEAAELQMDTPEDQDSLVCPDDMETPVLDPEPFEASEPPAKRPKSSEEATEKGPKGQPQAKVQPQTQMTAPKQTQTPDQLPEPPEAQVLTQLQPQVLQHQGQLQPRLQKQAQTQTSPEHLAPQQNQVQSWIHSQPPWQGQLQETMWGAGGSLKVTILQSSDSRAFNTTPLTSGLRPGDSTSAAPVLASIPSKQTLQFFCYICKTSCNSQQEFQDHLSEGQHQQRLGEMQRSSQTCLLSLLPMPRDILEREAEDPPPKRWCNTCQVYYMGDLIQHRRTQEHKVRGLEGTCVCHSQIAKQSLRPFCNICSRYFKTPRKFVEHVKSQGHKDKAKELKTLEKEIVNPEEEHFITVDAVGCFESDQEEDEDDEEEEEIEAEEEFCKQVRSGDTSLEEWKGSETYSPNTAYGVDFLVPAMGYVCRICHKFYDTNSGLRLSHCKSLAHFENLQKYKAAKNPSPASRPVSRRCAINARNALTALFTSSSSSGRPPSQPSSQDTAKIPSKVKPGCPKPPPSLRRSARLKT